MVKRLNVGTAYRLDRAGVAELEAEVGTMYVVSQLKLTGKQKQELLAICGEIAPAAADYLRSRKAWRKSTAKAVAEYLEHSVRTGEYPPLRIQQGLMHMARAGNRNTRRP